MTPLGPAVAVKLRASSSMWPTLRNNLYTRVCREISDCLFSQLVGVLFLISDRSKDPWLA